MLGQLAVTCLRRRSHNMVPIPVNQEGCRHLYPSFWLETSLAWRQDSDSEVVGVGHEEEADDLLSALSRELFLHVPLGS